MARIVWILLKFPGGNAEVNRVRTQLACEYYMFRSITFSYSLSSSFKTDVFSCGADTARASRIPAAGNRCIMRKLISRRNTLQVVLS